MLRRRSGRRSLRRHRLDALTLAWQHQTHTIVVQRSGAVRVADHTHKAIDIGRKPRFSVGCSEIHPSLQC